MDNPKISIITPSFNQGEYLDACLDSILSQDYPNKELIVVDGGSTDNSVEVIRKYEAYLSWWVSEKDNGQSDAINKGIRRMTGDVFNWINSDDCLYPGALTAVAKAFEGNGTTLVSGKTRRFEAMNDVLEPVVREGDDKYAPFRRLEYNQHGTFYDADFIRSIGGVNEHLHFCMDKEIWLKYLIMNGTSGIRTIDREVAGFRIQKSSKTSNYGVRFDDEYASLIWRLCDNGFSDIRKLLESRFNINPDLITRFEENTLPPDIVRSVALTMLINHSYLVFNKKDFRIGKQLVKLIEESDKNLLSNRQLEQLAELEKNVSPYNWFIFRVLRKMNSVRNS